MGWQEASGYNRRALAEATIGRFKRVIGDGLRSRTDQRQATKMNVAVAAGTPCWSWDARNLSASPERRRR